MHFALLGPVELIGDDGGHVAPAGPRQRVLLAALLLHANTPVSAEVLAEAVWDSSPSPAAVQTLRSYVRRLRRALGAAAAARIVAHDPGYLIRVADQEFDVLLFELLCRNAGRAVRAADWAEASAIAARALGLWRGEPLLDVPSQTLRKEFMPRLEHLQLQALEDCIEADLWLGRHDRLVPQLRDLTAAHPLRERFHAQLMLALARSGRRAEALDAFRRARGALVDELGIEPGADLQQLQKWILAGNDVLPMTALPRDPTSALPRDPAPARDRAHSRAPDRVVPRQLPAAAANFTGRRAELDTLLALLNHPGNLAEAAGTVVISAIDGMAGVGKSALAVHVAHRLADRFPDGQLFLDLHTHTQLRGSVPRSPGEALETLLHALGVAPQHVPQDTEARAGLYRQQLAGSRTLILLDNAADEAQVRPLLPGHAGCLVLVTSRRRLKGLDDAHTLSLDVLPQTDAITLLRAVAGPERATADDPVLAEIAELCGRLPLALRIAAVLLRHRPAWSLEHLAALLRGQQQRVFVLFDGERDLGAAFDLSYQSLTDEQRRLFRHLGLIPGPDTDAYAVAALADIDPGTATLLLEELVDHNLLIAHAVGRYRFHDLIRLHARARAEDDPPRQREAALGRLLDFYLCGAQQADRRIARTTPGYLPVGVREPAHLPELATEVQATSWARAELANLFAAVHHAAAQDHQSIAIALSAALHGYLRAHGPWSQALDLYPTAASLAQAAGDRHALATALGNLGDIQHLSGRYPQAGQSLGQALVLFRDLEDRRGQAHTLSALGLVQYKTAQYPEAIASHQQSLALFRDLADLRGEALALGRLCQVQCSTAQYSQATVTLTRAIGVNRDIADWRGLANVLTTLGLVLCETAQYAQATSALKQSLDLFRDLGDRSGQANALSALGLVQCNTAQHTQATSTLGEAIGLFKDLHVKRGQAIALDYLGRVQCASGQHAQAAVTLGHALDLFRDVGNRHGQALTLNDLGQLQQAVDRHPQAAASFGEALELFHGVGDLQGAAEALNHLGALAIAAGDFAAAREHHRKALADAREVGSPKEEADALAGLAESYLRQGAAGDGVNHLRQALAVSRNLGTPAAELVAARLAELEKHA